jgi:iron complex transport system substrate-binding protein
MTCKLASIALILTIFGPFALCQRVISMAPNLTESMFALDLQKHLVAVTDFCDYPPQARLLPRIGGYLDANLEAMVALSPDLVLVLPEHRDLSLQLQQLHIETLELRNFDLADLWNTLTRLGERFAVQARAEVLIHSLKQVLVQQNCPDATGMRCLVVIGREYGRGIRDLYCVGSKGYLAELLVLAGGHSVVQTESAHYPQLSAEGVLALDPDIILDLVPDVGLAAERRKAYLADWQQLSQLRAVRRGRVVVLADPSLFVIGPRIGQSLATLANALGCP